MEARCSYCGINSSRLFRCIQCKNALYCSHEHQKSHWKTHRTLCKAYMKPVLRPPTTYINTYDFQSEYEIAPSPVGSKLPIDDIKRNQQTQMVRAKHVVEKLRKKGYCIIDGFLGDAKGHKVLWDVTKILRSGVMKDGELVPTNSPINQRKVVRGDKIAWITGKEEIYDNMKLIMDAIDRLMRYCKDSLTEEHVIKGRTPAMVACYPGDGTGYKRHIDNTQKDGRCITCLYYLNKGWDTEQNGGQLRVFPSVSEVPVDIDPIFDRLFVFWSDKRTPHEVLPAYAERFAITLWYFDSVEREKYDKHLLAARCRINKKTTRRVTPTKGI